MNKKMDGTKDEQRTDADNGTSASLEQNGLLPAVQRPNMASDALQLLKEGVQVEMRNDKVFDFFRFIDRVERNFRCQCYVNEFTEGYTVIVHGR